MGEVEGGDLDSGPPEWNSPGHALANRGLVCG